MSGVSPQLIDLRKRIEERITTKEALLPKIDYEISHHQQKLAELSIQRTAIVLGVQDDKALLAGAAPKKPRTKKVSGKVETLGNQLDAGATTGGN